MNSAPPAPPAAPTSDPHRASRARTLSAESIVIAAAWRLFRRYPVPVLATLGVAVVAAFLKRRH